MCADKELLKKEIDAVKDESGLYNYDKFIENVRTSENLILKTNISTIEEKLYLYINKDISVVVTDYLLDKSRIFRHEIKLKSKNESSNKIEINLRDCKPVDNLLEKQMESYLNKMDSLEYVMLYNLFFLNPIFESNQEIKSILIEIGGNRIKTVFPNKNKYAINTNLAISPINLYSLHEIIYTVCFNTPIVSETKLCFTSEYTYRSKAPQNFLGGFTDNYAFQKLNTDEYLVIRYGTAGLMNNIYDEDINTLEKIRKRVRDLKRASNS